MTLSDPSFKTRAAALSDYEMLAGSELASHVARLDAEKHDRMQMHDRDIAEARALVAAKTIEIEAKIGADAKAALWPLAVAFADAPRTTAGKFAEAWNALNARSLEQLGAPLSYKFVGLAFAAAHGLAAQCAGPGFWVFDGINPAASACANAVQGTMTTPAKIFPGVAPVVAEAALREIELLIATRAGGYTAHPDRLEALTSRATEQAQRVALAAADEAAAAAAPDAWPAIHDAMQVHDDAQRDVIATTRSGQESFVRDGFR